MPLHPDICGDLASQLFEHRSRVDCLAATPRQRAPENNPSCHMRGVVGMVDMDGAVKLRHWYRHIGAARKPHPGVPDANAPKMSA